jgi:hypothetical protein
MSEYCWYFFVIFLFFGFFFSFYYAKGCWYFFLRRNFLLKAVAFLNVLLFASLVVEFFQVFIHACDHKCRESRSANCPLTPPSRAFFLLFFLFSDSFPIFSFAFFTGVFLCERCRLLRNAVGLPRRLPSSLFICFRCWKRDFVFSIFLRCFLSSLLLTTRLLRAWSGAPGEQLQPRRPCP